MNKIAVNPTQFITCRLCLEEFGNYQIVPSVKEQIEYCFDIKVEPFDGLPQLICQKCEVILSTYSDIKKKFIEKQNELMGKIFTAQGSHYEQLFDAKQPEKDSKSKSPKRKHSSSSDQDNNIKKITTKIIGIKSNASKKDKSSWQKNYTKQYVCKFCSSHWTNINSLRNHINNRHSTLSKKYSNTLKRHCQVNLNKCDEKPNLTGSRKQVVLANEKIVKNVNSDYHIIYTTRYYRRNKTSNNSDANVRNKKSKSRIKNKPDSSSDSSDEEIIGKRKRIRRISSKSSNDTLILHNKSNHNSDSDNDSRKVETINSPAACIDLDGSSESESGKNMTLKYSGKQLLNNNDSTAEQSTVTEIINSCRNKYIKKYYQDTISSKNPSDVANKLQHKILSIGRKIISKKVGVNCTPLLRFLEHKNLDVTWLNRDILSVSQDSNHIRIISRRKNTLEKMDCNEGGWIDYISTTKETFASYHSIDVPEQTNNQTNTRNGISVLESPISSDSLVSSDGHLVNLEIIKLLNANPVANPKQLPKKFASNEVKTPSMIVKSVEHIPQECMPIITSTTSLAAHPSKSDSGDPNRSEIDSTTDKQPEIPRIKVKPVSELMSAETLNRMQNPVHSHIQSPVQSHLQSPIHIPINIIGKGIPLSVQNVTVPTMPHIVASHSLLRRNNDVVSAEPAHQSDYLILDTVDMPNMKTNAPYLYVKKLLQMHNIILLDTHVEVPNDFHCLIKFKVLYKQDSQHEPVTLCLSLYCSKNVFCFNVKNRNNENIDLTKLACNWQWEVLKIYKGEVVDKLLHNAQKIGQDVYDITNSFLCLLKSINVKSKC